MKDNPRWKVTNVTPNSKVVYVNLSLFLQLWYRGSLLSKVVSIRSSNRRPYTILPIYLCKTEAIKRLRVLYISSIFHNGS